jgi:glycosyltransferase involved in cell wall biosynthesis
VTTIEKPKRSRARPDSPDGDRYLVSVVIPCLNEEQNIEVCVISALQAMDAAGISGEVIVADNASEDRSAELATAAGARVITEKRRGYGSAYLAGFGAARGTYIVMADADLTYDFAEVPRFVERLEAGAELVMGDRMKNIHKGAMPWHHRYIGNPVLTKVLNVFYRTGVSDAHCGMRGLRRDVLPRLDLRTTGMEFASEMVIRASKEQLVIDEFPIEYRPRGGQSKLSSWRDGWRHLRFLLVHSPNYLFILPGLLLFLVGSVMAALSLTGVDIFGRQLQLHAMVLASLCMIIGTQVVALGLAAHAYGAYFMNEKDPWFDRNRARFRLEHGLLIGGFVVLLGVVVGGAIFAIWAANDFNALSEERLAILAATLVVVGTQIFFSSFLLSILGLRRDG